MSRYNLTLQMDTYTDDFGNSYDNVPVQIQKSRPVPGLYGTRATSICGNSKRLFTPRAIVATFPDGGRIRYPIPDETQVAAAGAEIKGLGAVCLDYYGEKWNILVGATVGGDLAYTSTPYAGLVASKEYETGSFAYTSRLGVSGLQNFRLPYRVPSNDDDNLAGCQKNGMSDIEASSGVCSAAGLVSPRRLIIRAKADDGVAKLGSVSRNSLQSVGGSTLKGKAIAIASCAFCLGYRGENFNGLHNYV